MGLFLSVCLSVCLSVFGRRVKNANNEPILIGFTHLFKVVSGYSNTTVGSGLYVK